MLWGIVICIGLLALIYAAFASLAFFKKTKLSRSSLSIAFLFKLFGAVALFLIYSFHYQDRANSDIFKYYDDAVLIYSHSDWQITEIGSLFQTEAERSSKVTAILKDTQHWDQQWHILPNDNRLMILVNLLLLYLSQDFYFFHLLCFAMLSFVGSIALFHFFNPMLNLGPRLLAAILILPPSTLLWSSGMLKESLFFFAFGLFLYSIHKIKRNRSWQMALLLLTMLALSSWVKAYLLICFLPALLLYLFNDRLKLRNNLLLIALSLLSLSLILWWPFESSLNAQLQRFTALAFEIEANTYFPIESRNGLIDFIFGIPEALYNVWVRPILMWDKGIFSLINSIESLVYLLLPIGLIRFRRKSKIPWLLIWMLISFLFLASIIIGSTVPVMGAILRYRSPLLPFYLILLFTFVDTYPLKQIFRKNET